MRHRDAVQLLPDWATSTLVPATVEALRLHATHCPACRDWLATHQLLTEELTNRRDDKASHPRSDLLALCATRPEELDEPGRDELREHLATCAACRHSVAVTTEAVQQARPIPERPSTRTDQPATSRHPWRLALAAGLTAFLVGGGIYAASWWLDGRDLPSGSFVASGPEAVIPTISGSVEEFCDHDLAGTTVVRADSGLMVARVMVRDGADVTFEAGDRVILGDGFRVATGGRLRIGSGKTAHREEPEWKEVMDSETERN